MAARTKGRAKFEFRGRAFLWWVDNDKYLRICSADKRFVIAFTLGAAGASGVEVIGQEFPGIAASEPRPVRFLREPPTGDSMGAWVDELLRWSFDPAKSLTRSNEPFRFC